MTRRVLLGTGAAVVGAAGLVTAAELTGRLDDVAEAVGLDPKPLPDPDDTRLVRRAGVGAAALLATLEATAARHTDLALEPFVAVAREHVAAVSGPSAGDATAPDATTPPDDTRAAVDALEKACRQAADDRAADAEAAFSPDLARVLASMSAGLSQSARQVRGLR